MSPIAKEIRKKGQRSKANTRTLTARAVRNSLLMCSPCAVFLHLQEQFSFSAVHLVHCPMKT